MSINPNHSPLQKILLPGVESRRFPLFLKRDDLLDTPVSGNKWRKLKYLIEYATNEKIKDIVTWGGAFSNHIYACSILAKEYGISITGIIPTCLQPYPPSLQQAAKNGLVIKEVSRTVFRKRFDKGYLADLQIKNPDTIFLAEGGNSPWSEKGVAEMVQECNSQEHDIDYWVVAVGSGGTITGIISALSKGQVLGINAVKGSYPEKQMKKRSLAENSNVNWEINYRYELGGMGKTTVQLIDFINSFYTLNGIKLDPVYNGKMLFAIQDLLVKRYFQNGSKICAIHTGGQSGIENFIFKNPGLLHY